MLIPITDHLWVEPSTVTSVERVTVDRHGRPVDFVEIHCDKQFWMLSDVDLAEIVARVNAPQES